MPPEQAEDSSGFTIAGGVGESPLVQVDNANDQQPSPTTTGAPNNIACSSPTSSSENYKSASDIAVDAAVSSVLGKLASLLSCSRMGNTCGGSGSGQNANDLQTAQLKEALSQLIVDNGTDSTSLTIPSMTTQTTASPIVHAQRHSDKLRNLGPQETTAFKLSTPLLGHGSREIPELPSHLRDNVGATLSGLVDSRVKSSMSVLVKQMISLGSLDEAKALAQLSQNPSAITINAIVTTFRPAKKAEPPTSHADGTKTWNLPLIFEVVADISIHNNKTSTLMMTSSGSISGTFDTSSSAINTAKSSSSSSSYLLKDAVVTIDTVTLLTAMVTQARKVGKLAVRHLAEIIGSAAAKERENEKKRAAAVAVEAYKQRQKKEKEEEKRLFQLLQQHNQTQPMQQQQQPPLSDLIDLNQLHSILSQSGSSASSTANMASLASVASLLNGPYGKSEHSLGGGMLSGHSRGNLLQSGTKNQSFFSISNNNNNSNKPFTAPESLSNLQPLPFISMNNFHQQSNHQMQQINANNMQSNANNLNQLFPTLPPSYEPQNQRRLSQEEMEETRKMIDSTEGLPSSLAQVAAELRVETEAANKKRRAKRRRSSAESNATADSSSSYQFSLDTITTGCNEGEAQPLTLSTLFAKQDEMFEEERRKRSATETLVGCNHNNSGDGGIGDRGAVQGSSTFHPTASGVSTTTKDQLLALLKQSGADDATMEAAANLLFQDPAKDNHLRQAEMHMQPAAVNMNAGVNANAAVSQALQASAPSMLSLLTPEGKSGKGSDIANFAASFVSGHFPHSFSSLSAGSLWDNRKRSARTLSGEISVTDGNLKKKVSFNMVNETFTSL